MSLIESTPLVPFPVQVIAPAGIPAGKLSNTTTLVASAGPLLVTVIK